jgi:hypothetical protein
MKCRRCAAGLLRFGRLVAAVAALTGRREDAVAQTATFAGNAQHTGVYDTPAQRLNQVLWSTKLNLNNSGIYIHYGAPVITASNTVIVPVRTTNGFELNAFEGKTGRLKYTLATDYVSPRNIESAVVYQPALAIRRKGTRLYYAGAGGTVYFIIDPDSDSPGAPTQVCFYTNIESYSASPAAYSNSVFIDTPLTPGPGGDIYFGFVSTTNGAFKPFGTNEGGFARVDPSGDAVYVFATKASGTVQAKQAALNVAPALSNDGATLYVAAKRGMNGLDYLLGLNSTNLILKYRSPPTSTSDNSTASPMVAPDGDVYFSGPGFGSRWAIVHYNSDLSTKKPPGSFGWDSTPAVVPTNMVPRYSGNSPYLLFNKYNYYAYGGGNGVNKVALLDLNTTQPDPYDYYSYRKPTMREVATVIGSTPDSGAQGSSYPYAVREWCINAAAVNPRTKSILAPCEDGRLYRWNLADDSLTETISLALGFGEPYVPTVVGPDGIVYTLNGGTLFAVGGLSNVAVAVYSSAPNLRSFVAGQPVTFTAIVTNLDATGPAPTGLVTLKDVTFQGIVARTNALGTLHLPNNGTISVTTSNLIASPASNYLGSHFIIVTYTGDTTFPPGSATLVQKVHASASVTKLSASGVPGSNIVTFTASVASSSSVTNKPTGMISFWEGQTFLAQLSLDTAGMATFTNSSLGPGNHIITANYYSDTVFAASAGSLLWAAPSVLALTPLNNGAVLLSFTNLPGAQFAVLSTTNLTVSISNWSRIGSPSEISPGLFQYIDPGAAGSLARFYRLWTL